MALLPVAEALERILKGAEPLPAQSVSLAAAFGAVLAEDVAALRTQPPADVSAMDGYALRAVDVSSTPATLKVIGEVAAGHPFDRTIGAGEAARIFTGGVVPAGADTVTIQENTERSGDSVVVKSPLAPGRHIRRAGIDFKQGDVLLKKGMRLNDRDVMLAAGMNHASLAVHRAPKVAMFATGDELVAPGTAPKPGQIVHSNGFALAAMLRAEGAEVIDLGIIGDRLHDIAAAIRKARDIKADVLMTTGGASVGDHDLVHKALQGEGTQLSFWKIAMRPGRPLMHGKLTGMHVFGLPGNPVSSYVCAFLFALPLVRSLAGRSDIHHRPIAAKLGVDLPANDERQDYLRVRLLVNDDNTLTAAPRASQDSSLMVPLSAADGLLIREPRAPAAPAGSPCVILKFGL